MLQPCALEWAAPGEKRAARKPALGAYRLGGSVVKVLRAGE